MTFDQKLDKLAEVVVKVGLNLQESQELVVVTPLEAVPLVRLIAKHAYQVGAKLVTPIYSDSVLDLIRYQHAPSAAFDYAPAWLFDGMVEAAKGNAARLGISGANPALLTGQDPDKVARANKARSIAARPINELVTGFDINWCLISFAHPAWAEAVFPGDPKAVDKLWDAIFAASRADQPDPLAAWKTHDANLHARRDHLNQKRYAAVRFQGPGTDLTVGLADDHLWSGGATMSKNGILCNPNIPTEEIFTTPHKDRIEGYVSSTKPLSYQGTLLEEIWVRFEKGSIVESRAKSGESVLNRALDTDAGARSLGEVALVPHSSPISQSGILFLNSLFDENAASHIALGDSYAEAINDGYSLTPEQLAAKGANSSLIHIDWMIGSDKVDVDGITQDGSSEPLMRGGEWV